MLMIFMVFPLLMIGECVALRLVGGTEMLAADLLCLD
jgi:hypothetical protein